MPSTAQNKDYYSTIAGFIKWQTSRGSTDLEKYVTSYKNRTIVRLGLEMRTYVYQASSERIISYIEFKYYVAYKGRYWKNHYNSIEECLEAIDRRAK